VPATARVGDGDAFVVEADEYAGNFDAYRPDIVVLTTIEWDHPDVFASRASVLDAFERWLDRVPDATLIANLEDPGVVELLGRVAASPARTGAIVGVSLTGQAAGGAAASGPTELWIDRSVAGRIVDRTPDGFVLDIDGLAASTRRVHLPAVGDHNASNALLALVAAAEVDPGPPDGVDRLIWGLTSFPGIGRRLERKGEARGVVVYDDYGHHPTAIRATLAALRQREPERRVWAVYEPLTFHRTAAMLPEFADALAEADAVAVANIWASRDLDTTATSPELLAAAVRARRPGMTAMAAGSVEETAAWLARNVAEGDAVLVMGGGHSYKIADLLLEALRST
jgi:UDP-N-acetylmuramate--alanine ligase